MSPTLPPLRPLPLLLLLLCLVAPASLWAQGSGWSPAQVGVRFGYDNKLSSTVLGGQIRIPVVPSGLVEVMPSADVTFARGLREYQYNVDAVVVGGGPGGGLYAGGGVAFRNSVFQADAPRETRTGTNLVLGLTTRGGLGTLPVDIQAEARWVFLDTNFDPQIFTFGVNLPLWGARGRR